MKFLILYTVFRRSTRNQSPTSLDESAMSCPYVTRTYVNRNYETTLEFTRMDTDSAYANSPPPGIPTFVRIDDALRQMV